MATSTLDRLREERDQAVHDAEAIMSGESFDPDDAAYTDLKARAALLNRKIDEFAQFEQSRAAADKVDGLFGRLREQTDRDRRGQMVEDRAPIGDLFVRSQAYEDYRQVARGKSGNVTVPWESLFQARANILTSTYPGVIPVQRVAPSEAPAQQTPLLDVIPTVPVQNNAVEWVYFPAAAPLAAVVAEGSAKPEASVAPALRTATLQTIAHWVTVSRQFLEDSGAIGAYVNEALRRGVVDKFEAEAAAALISGTSGIPVTDNTDGTLLQGIRRAIGSVQAAGYRPQIVALNPMDYAFLDIDVLGRTLLGPQVGTQFWGVRPVAIGAIPSGTAYVGDFAAGMQRYVRNEATIYATDSHASNFTSNLITILAEGRGLSVVHRPEALTKVVGTVELAPLTGGGSARK